MNTMQKICLSLLLCGYLGICNGHLALFENGKAVEIFPYSADRYPPADQDALRDGIPYSTPLEKQRILENYLS